MYDLEKSYLIIHRQCINEILAVFKFSITNTTGITRNAYAHNLQEIEQFNIYNSDTHLTLRILSQWQRVFSGSLQIQHINCTIEIM